MRILFILPLLFLLTGCSSAEKRSFTVVAKEHTYLDCMVSIDPGILYTEVPENLVLFMETDEGPQQISFQADPSVSGNAVTFVVNGILEKGASRNFYFREGGKRESEQEVRASIDQSEEKLVILEDDREVLTYHISATMPPEDVDSIYKRSAYIHPLVSPGGEVLTRIQPPDHYHHYGIWNPWTKTHIKGREIDYWNLGKGEGTVRTEAVLSTFEGPVYTSFTALHHYLDFGANEGERVTMDEIWEVSFRETLGDDPRYIVDLQTTLRNVLRDTILFDAYRYGGGLGYRATGKWNAENSTVLTSEGADRKSADGSRARWCLLEGVSDTEAGRSGILFLSHPDNREHPEPMRVWPPDSQHGAVFFEFCPIRYREWQIIPGADHVLKYRMIIFDGEMTPEEADMYWNGFAYGPEAGV